MTEKARSMSAALGVLAVALCSLVFVAGASAANVTNGDFESGNLTGWSTFLTAGGVIDPGPGVESFDTTGSGASNAAMFAVGRNTGIGAPEGGGIYQSVNTIAGTFNVSADVAALASVDNLSCGFFELLVDGAVVASHDFSAGDFSACPAGTTVRTTLSASGLSLTTGSHEVRIRISRGYTLSPISGNRPRQYVDNVSLTQVTVALPTAKGQCQNNGWKDYGVFKNVGDCVKFVATGGSH